MGRVLEIRMRTHVSGSGVEMVFVGEEEWEDRLALVRWFSVCRVRRVGSVQFRAREVPLSCQW